VAGSPRTISPVIGDRVEVVIDTGAGTQTYEIEASKAGRRVEVNNARGGIVEVTEVTRSGKPVRVGRFMASRVIALVEHPASDGDDGDDGGTSLRGRRRIKPAGEQGNLL
jgi:hypothetical protein